MKRLCLAALVAAGLAAVPATPASAGTCITTWVCVDVPDFCRTPLYICFDPA